jgi:hypothetical protein
MEKINSVKLWYFNISPTAITAFKGHDGMGMYKGKQMCYEFWRWNVYQTSSWKAEELEVYY